MIRLLCLLLAVIGAGTAQAHEKMVEVFAVPRNVDTVLEGMPASNEPVLLFFVVDDHTVPDMDASPEVGLYPNSVGMLLRRQAEDIDLGRADLRMESDASTAHVRMAGTLTGVMPADPACAGTYDEETRLRTHECSLVTDFQVDVGEAVGTSSFAAVDENTYSLRTGQTVDLRVDRRECDETVSPEECAQAPVWTASFDVLAIRVVNATPVEPVTWGSLKARYGRE